MSKQHRAIPRQTTRDASTFLPMGRRPHRKSPGGLPLRRLALEPLEDRRLLSATFQFDHLVYNATGSAAPPSTALTPSQIKAAYKIDRIIDQGLIQQGQGQTIAIIAAYDNPEFVSRSNIANVSQDPAFLTSDLHNFDVQYGLTEPAGFFTKVDQRGGTSYPACNTSWGTEIALNVEWVHAIAPLAKIVLVEADSADATDLLQAAAWARDNSGASVIMMGFGAAEQIADASLDATFHSASNHGITWIAPTGNNGAPAQYPATSPNVVAVGGTTLNAPNGSYLSETAWSGSGGGISNRFAQPTYQQGLAVHSGNNVVDHGGMRVTPDVSFNADPASGVAIYDSFAHGTSAPWVQVGGTSLAATAWSAIFAIANEIRADHGLPSLDGTTAALATLYGCDSVHDITAGNNGYTAAAGYDLTTGIGTPMADTLVRDIAGVDFVVRQTTPSRKSTIAAPTSTFTSTFSFPVDPATLQPSDLIVNGAQANSVTLSSDGMTATFTFVVSPITAEGTQTISIPAGAVAKLSNPLVGNRSFGVTFQYDSEPLKVLSTSPAPGGTFILPGPLTYDVTFNEPLSPSSVATTCLNLSGIDGATVTGATLLSDNRTIRFTINGVPSEGTLTASILAGLVTDQYGNPGAPFSATYASDNSTVEFPGSLTAVTHLGSLIYQTDAISGTLTVGDEGDAFTLAVDPRQTVTVLITPLDPGLQPELQVFDLSNALLGAATASAPGRNALVQTVPTNNGVVFRFVVKSAAQTSGRYTIQVTLNSALESESNLAGVDNDSLATAQPIDASLIELASSSAARRGAVLGSNVVMATETLALANFETGETGYIVDNGIRGTGDNAGLWHVCTRRGNEAGHSALGSFYYGSETAGNYDMGAATAGSITSPSVALPAGSPITLTFNYILQTESETAWDTARVLVSKDGFATFTTIATRSTNLPNVSEWTKFTADLSSFAGTTVQIRFVFDTVDGVLNAYEGWYVDDVDVATSGQWNDYYSVMLTAGNLVTLGLENQSGAGNTLSLITPTGDVLATAITGPSNIDQVIKNVSIPATGQYYIRVAGKPVATYSVTVAIDATLDMEPNDNLAGAQRLSFPASREMVVLGHLASTATIDYYTIQVAAGQTLTLITDTTGGGSGQFENTLNPKIDIYSSGGSQLMANANGAPDGRNAKLMRYFPTAGSYTVRLMSEANSGEYTLRAILSNAVYPDLTVKSSHVGSFRRGDMADKYSLTVTNSGTGPTSGTVTVTDTLPNGLTAVAFSGDGWTTDLATLTATRSDPLPAGASYPPLTLTVSVAETTAEGVNNSVTVSGGGNLNTLNDTGYDATEIKIALPRVTATTPMLTSGKIPIGTSTLVVTFNQAVVGAANPSNYELRSPGADHLLGTSDDVILPLSASYSGTAATLSFAALPADTYRLTVRDTITDSAGAKLDGNKDGIAGGDWSADVVAVVGVSESDLFAVTSYNASSSQWDVASGDFNGDGYLDFVATVMDGSVAVYLGDGSGGFGQRITTSLDISFATGIACADFNRDGKLDVAVADQSTGRVLIALGNGLGSFSSATTLATGATNVWDVDVADFNSDGNMDLVATNLSGSSVSVFSGNGGGGFSSPVQFSSGGSNPYGLTVADLNADGHADLVVSNAIGSLGILLGDGAGAFPSISSVSFGGSSNIYVITSDFNNDSRIDLAVSNLGNGTVSVLLGNGNGTFGAATHITVPDISPVGIIAGDFNNDGNNDLVVPNYGNSSILGLLLGNGNGSFASSITIQTLSGYGMGMAAADFNYDGQLDLVVAHAGGGAIGVMLNQSTRSWEPLVSANGLVFDFALGHTIAGALIQGYKNVADGDGRLIVGGLPFEADYTGFTRTDGGCTLVTTSTVMSQLKITRRITVPNTGAEDFARTIDVFENATDSDITTTVSVVGNLGSNAATRVFATSDGDTDVETTDTWIGTDGGAGTPAVIHYIHGPLGLKPTSVEVIGDNIRWTYDLTVRAGKTARLGYFTIVADNVWTAIGAANALVTDSGFGAEAASFLSTAELQSLVNFLPADALPAATVILDTDTPRTTSVLTATATKYHPAGDPVALTFVWKINGAVVRTYATEDLTDSFDLVASGVQPDDVITVEVTPDDGILSGTTATDTATVVGSVRTWDGGGSDDRWTNAVNWADDIAPITGDLLVFAGETQTTSFNDFPAYTGFEGIVFDSAGFTLSGNLLLLAPRYGHGIENVLGQNRIDLPLALSQLSKIVVRAGSLVIGPDALPEFLVNGRVDIQSGSLVLDYDGQTNPGTTVNELLTVSYSVLDTSHFYCGRLQSSNANAKLGLGWRDDADAKLLTIAFAPYGDADLSGTVDFSDLGALLAHYGTAGNPWALGDFNYDGNADFSDLGILLANWNKSIADLMTPPWNGVLLCTASSESPALGIVGLSTSAAPTVALQQPVSTAKVSAATTRGTPSNTSLRTAHNAAFHGLERGAIAAFDRAFEQSDWESEEGLVDQCLDADASVDLLAADIW